MDLQVSSYLLHRSPSIFLDKLLASDERHALAKMRIHEELIFVEEEGLPTWTSIEIMAQTVSLYSGAYHAQKNLPPRLGFLLGTKLLVASKPYFPMGSELLIRVKKKYMLNGLGAFECEIWCNEIYINSILKVYQPDYVE